MTTAGEEYLENVDGVVRGGVDVEDGRGRSGSVIKREVYGVLRAMRSCLLAEADSDWGAVPDVPDLRG